MNPDQNPDIIREIPFGPETPTPEPSTPESPTAPDLESASAAVRNLDADRYEWRPGYPKAPAAFASLSEALAHPAKPGHLELSPGHHVLRAEDVAALDRSIILSTGWHLPSYGASRECRLWVIGPLVLPEKVSLELHHLTVSTPPGHAFVPIALRHSGTTLHAAECRFQTGGSEVFDDPFAEEGDPEPAVGFEVSGGASANFIRCEFLAGERWCQVGEDSTVLLTGCRVSGLKTGMRLSPTVSVELPFGRSVKCGWCGIFGGELQVVGGVWRDTDLAAHSGARVRFEGVEYRGKGSLLLPEECAFGAEHCRFREFGDLSCLISVGRNVQAQFRLCEFEAPEPLTPEIFIESGMAPSGFQACLWNGELVQS